MSWKREIAKQLSVSSQTSLHKTNKIISNTLAMINDILAKEGKIELRNFGVLKVAKRKARTGRNPKTGEVVFVPSKYCVKFVPSKEMIQNIIEQERQNNILLESYRTETQETIK
jgi:integration host factor subunit beta